MSLLETLSKTIDHQQAAQTKDYEEIMGRKLQDRIHKGYTMTNLHIAPQFYQGTPNYARTLPRPFQYLESVRINCITNNLRFREGSQVLLSNSAAKLKFLMEVTDDGITGFTLHSNSFELRNNYMDSENYPKDDWELNIVNQEVTHKLLRATWDILSLNPEICSFYEHLLEGKIKNDYSTVKISPCDNESQNEAIRKALTCNHFHLIQGPPGTGKTFTISKLVSILIDQGKKVFVTGPTHTSINNCLNAVSKLAPDRKKIVKLGERYQAEEILGNAGISRERSLKMRDYAGNPKFSQEGIAVGATPYALCYPASKKLEGWRFDYAIFDEAAQLSVPLALSAMLFAKKIIFVGDHKQLDPIIPKNNDLDNYFGYSIFRKMTDLYPDDITLLNQSYRLNENLIRIPNKLFYNSRLSSVRATEKPFLTFNCEQSSAILNSDSSEILVLHHVFDSLERSTFEAETVSNIVYDLSKNGVSLNEIGIISPYRAQVREIKRVLVQRGVVAEDVANLMFIDTVERMQGQEKAYIIYSMSNANPAEVEDRLEFFFSPNRLNVAITRAYVKSIVIANAQIFKCCEDILSGDFSDDVKNCADIFLRYRDLSTKLELCAEEEDW